VTATPNLDAALVAAQAEAKSLKRDGKNQHGGYKYATADQVADLGRQLLTKHGLCWTRISSTLSAPVLATSDIGNQAYVGDVTIGWKLKHGATGETDSGSAQYPVITSKQRPHEKAVAASVTYGCGQIIQGILCWDREDEKHAVDRRADGVEDDAPVRPPASATQPRNDGARCNGPKGSNIAKACRSRAIELAKLEGRGPLVVWETWCHALAVQPLPDGSWPKAEQLLVEDGKRLSEALKEAIAERKADLDRQRPEPPEREPGDDPDEDEVPEDDARALADETARKLTDAFPGTRRRGAEAPA
jgi:hypothetical protein